MKQSEVVVQWLRYAEYVAEWVPVSFRERPKCRVIKDGDGFKLVHHA